MPIRAEVSADRDRGPGHALLRLSGLRATPPFDLAVERSQGTTPYLGAGGVWQATEAWHPVREAAPAGDTLVVALGPDLVDPLVQQGVTVTFRVWVATDTAKECGTLKVQRPLLGSRAAAPHPTAVAAPAPPAPAVEPPPAPEAPAPEPPPPAAEPSPDVLAPVGPPPARRGLWIAAAVILLALAGAGAAAWYACWVPGFGAPGCNAAPMQPAGGNTATSAGTRSCTGLDGAQCLEVAQAALAARDVEAARQLFQQASQLGSVEANNAMARMYDPKTWQADTSPVPQADWETAVYWYETAARQNDPAGRLGAGRLLCAYATTSFERQRGLEYLQTAATSGSDEAKTLVAECETKVTP